MSAAELKRSALETGEWLWGAVQGGFNEKLSVGQVVFDATLSAFPIAGEVTAVRDVIAQLIRMCKSPKLWQEVMEWVLLLLPLLAIIPLLGGLLKGIGKLLLMAGKSVEEDKKILAAMIALSNRLGHGNGENFVRKLDFSKYQSQLITGFNTVIQRMDDALRVTANQLQSVLPQAVLDEFADLRAALSQLKALGGKMIPEAIKELNTRLRNLQQLAYSGERHSIAPGSKNITRESEVRLSEQGGPATRPPSKGYPNNKLEDYVPKEGWPNLLARAKYDTDKKIYTKITVIEAFSGPIKAKTLPAGTTLYRVLKVPDNDKISPWWTETLPKNAQEWREGLAVLDKFNKNTTYIKYTIPEGRQLNVWEGKAAEQFDEEAQQFLGGGGIQLFIEWPAEMKAVIDKLPVLANGWGKTIKKYGYEMATNAKNKVNVDKLANSEYASKKPPTESKP